MAPYFLVEGCDGVGKSTLVNLLSKKAEAEGFRVLVTKEPGSEHPAADYTMKLSKLMLDSYYQTRRYEMANILTTEAQNHPQMTDVGRRLIRRILDRGNVDMDNLDREYLAQIIRSIHLERLVRPACEGILPNSMYKLDLILQDRGTLSAWAYGHMRGLSMKRMYELMQMVCGDDWDEMYTRIVYLHHSDVSECLKRAAKVTAESKQLQEDDVIEKAGTPAQVKAREGFAKYTSLFPDRMVVKVDVTQRTAEEVAEDVWKNVVRPLLPRVPPPRETTTLTTAEKMHGLVALRRRRLVGTCVSPPETIEGEAGYLHTAWKIIHGGDVKLQERTGTGTVGITGNMLRFRLDQGFPLLTTKRVFWRGVVEELLWMCRGETNAKLLAAKGVHIWDDNTSRQFLDARGLKDYPEGALGPGYGFQWRHFGAAYRGPDADYKGQGVDQIANIIHQLRTDPFDRRMILTAWNPADLPKMAMVPCHCMAHFTVTSEMKLNCMLFQRSADWGLGVPFNIASYALLTHMLAFLTGREVGELVYTTGDTHIYLDHLEPITDQLCRAPKPFPRLTVSGDKRIECIEDFTFENFTLYGYEPYEAIKMKMAV